MKPPQTELRAHLTGAPEPIFRTSYLQNHTYHQPSDHALPPDHRRTKPSLDAYPVHRNCFVTRQKPGERDVAVSTASITRALFDIKELEAISTTTERNTNDFSRTGHDRRPDRPRAEDPACRKRPRRRADAPGGPRPHSRRALHPRPDGSRAEVRARPGAVPARPGQRPDPATPAASRTQTRDKLPRQPPWHEPEPRPTTPTAGSSSRLRAASAPTLRSGRLWSRPVPRWPRLRSAARHGHVRWRWLPSERYADRNRCRGWCASLRGH